jgi:hypothetical protein
VKSPNPRISSLPLWVFLVLVVLVPRPALAVKRDVIRGFQEDFGGRTYRLRVNLQGTNYMSVPNVMSAKGFKYVGREFPVLFRRMQMVYLDRISNESGKSVALTIYRTKNDAGQIRGSIPSAPMNPASGASETALGSFARDFSTTVILELTAEKTDLDAQREQILELLQKVFYVREEPTFEEKQAFIRENRDMPVQKLMDLTGLPEQAVRQILEHKPVEAPAEKPSE